MTDLNISGGNCSIECFCSRYDIQNYGFIVQTWLSKSDLQDLRNSIRPGATGELFKILGRPRFYDKSWSACYSSDTDILTKDGWISLKELVETKLKIRVATLNPDKDIVEYHYPLNYMKYPYNGKMFHQSGRSIDFLVTPNHKVWCRRHERNYGKTHKGYEFVLPNEIPKPTQYRRDFPYTDGIDLPSFYIIPEYSNTWKSGRDYKLVQTYSKPKKEIPITTWLKFLGWFISEGYTSDRMVGIGQSWTVNPENCLEIETIIKEMGYKITYSKIRDIHGSYIIHDVQLANDLKKFGKDKDRYIPVEYKKSKPEYIQLLFDSLIRGDGHLKNGIYSTYSSSSLQLINDVAELGIKLGYVTTILPKKGDGTYDIIFSGKRYYNNLPNRGCGKREWIDYNDYVYCVEVPNNIIYTRRNGKSCWNGNSNTLTFTPTAGSQLSKMRQTRTGFVKNITTHPINEDWIGVKMELYISGNQSL